MGVLVRLATSFENGDSVTLKPRTSEAAIGKLFSSSRNVFVGIANGGQGKGMKWAAVECAAPYAIAAAALG